MSEEQPATETIKENKIESQSKWNQKCWMESHPQYNMLQTPFSLMRQTVGRPCSCGYRSQQAQQYRWQILTCMLSGCNTCIDYGGCYFDKQPASMKISICYKTFVCTKYYVWNVLNSSEKPQALNLCTTCTHQYYLVFFFCMLTWILHLFQILKTCGYRHILFACVTVYSFYLQQSCFIVQSCIV